MKFDLIIEDTTHRDVLQSFFVVAYWDSGKITVFGFFEPGGLFLFIKKKAQGW